MYMKHFSSRFMTVILFDFSEMPWFTGIILEGQGIPIIRLTFKTAPIGLPK